MSEEGKEFLEFILTMCVPVFIFVCFAFLLTQCDAHIKLGESRVRAGTCKEVTVNYKEFKDCLENGF